MVTCCQKSLSTGFHTDQSLNWALSCYLFSFCFMPWFCWHNWPTRQALCSSCRAVKQLSEKLCSCKVPLAVSNRRLTAASPDVDSQYERRMPVPVQASVFRWLLCLYTKKEHGCFLFHIAWVSGGVNVFPTVYLLVLQRTRLKWVV